MKFLKDHTTRCCGMCCADWGLLILRIALGIIFILHGWGKLFGGAPGMEGFTMMVMKIGFPAPVVFAYVAALTEFLGGIAMLLGIFTRVFGPLIAFVMLVAFITVKKGLPAGDPDLALFAMAIALTLMGPGRFSLTGMMKKDKVHKDGGCECGGNCGCHHEQGRIGEGM